MNEATTPSAPIRRRGLGRGLDALLGSPEALVEGNDDQRVLIDVDPATIRPNPEQPRSHFDPDELAALADSIKLHGLLQPIVIELVDGSYRLVAGERRLRASRLAALSRIPAIVRPTSESARQALELALTENVVRSNLSALEEAAAYARLADTFGLTHDAIALRLGKSRPAVTNIIRLLALSAEIQQAIVEDRLSAGHGRALLALPTTAAQESAAKEIEAKQLSVRQTEELVQRLLNEEPANARKAKPQQEISIDDQALQRGLESALGTPVRIQRRGRGGKIVIDFHSDDDLDALYRRMGAPQP